MNKENKELFLNIDGVGELMNEYCMMLANSESAQSHTILIHGDTGCGKTFFSEECKKKVIEKNSDVIEIDLIGIFKSSNYSSKKKLNKVLEIIEYELIEKGTFDKLKGQHDNPEIFQRILKKILMDTNRVLLIRFPEIEVFDEIEKYYAYFCNENTISYFITEKRMIVEECKKKIEKNITYFECKHLKEGDGKLFVENLFSDLESPKFNVDELEQLMSNRPMDNKMTIKELKKICEYTYSYAQKKGIKDITNGTIALAMAYNSKL